MSVLSINDFVIEDGVLIEYRGESTTPVVPEGVIAIAGGAFAFCNVTKVTLPSTVKELHTCGKEVFDKLYHCVNRINICFAPSPEEDWLNTSSEREGFENSLDEDDDFEISFEKDDFEFFDDVFFYEDACQVPWVGPFYCCYNLEEINLPDGLRIIPKGAFCECRKLKAITIPNSVYKIGCDAFYRCEKLKEITIPSQVNVIVQFCKIRKHRFHHFRRRPGRRRIIQINHSKAKITPAASKRRVISSKVAPPTSIPQEHPREPPRVRRQR